jgi:DNA-binding NarL/FixJ family response regulator
MFCQCLVWVLSKEARFDHCEISEVDGTAENLRSLVQDKGPDVALVDLALPRRGAVELTRHLCGTLDATVVLIVAAAAEDNEHDQQLLLECVEAGAQGFVYEQSTMDELIHALEQVEHGKVYCSHLLMESMMNHLALFSREARWRRNVKPVGLTRREQEILGWIAEGMSNKQVASQLSLSTYTVKNHVHKILGKLQVADRTEAVRRAIEESWLPAPSIPLRK